jgi:hypothetical protein
LICVASCSEFGAASPSFGGFSESSVAKKRASVNYLRHNQDYSGEILDESKKHKKQQNADQPLWAHGGSPAHYGNQLKVGHCEIKLGH